MDIFSQADRDECRLLHKAVHDEFSRDIVVIKQGSRTIVAQDPSYNLFYDRNKLGDKSINTTSTRHLVKGRVSYTEPKLDSYSDPSIQSQIRLRLPSGSIRIKLDQDGFDLMRGVRQIEFDGGVFGVRSDFKPLRVFENQFFVFYASPLEESHED